MNQAHVKVFLQEIDRQCSFARFAYSDMEASLASIRSSAPRDYEQCQLRFWYNVQSLLVAVGNISKTCWPVKKYDERGLHLRQLLALNETSPLNSRLFRNHFEQFDERLEVWVRSGSRRVADSNLSPGLGYNPMFKQQDVFRNYDTESNELLFQGERYQLRRVHKAVLDLHQRTKQLLQSDSL